MKILVPIKRVIDRNIKVQPKPDGADVDLNNVKMGINPFCEIALEEAIRLKEARQASEVIVVCVGSSKSQEQLRTALAMGADRTLHIITEENLEPLAIAKCLAAIYQQEQPGLVIFGRQSIDADNNQTGQLFAALCQLPQATFASSIQLAATQVEVAREVDDGQETLELKLPAVVTADLRLNTPRFVTLPNIMKAKQKPLQSIAVEELGVDIRPRTVLLGVSAPPQRKSGIRVANAAELIDKLRHEARVIQ